ncbi:MAG: hypothetical protein GXP46_13315 [Deferribacteres bacterium]|nr:hypothetical protein [Deferribacteres bacterium]
MSEARKKHLLLNRTWYITTSRWWLTAILLFLPFQHITVTSLAVFNKTLSTYFNSLDEATVFFFFPLSLIELYRNGELKNRCYLILFVPIFILCASGLVSGMVNGNRLIVTVLGIIDYIKIFLFIFIYAAFFRDFSEFRKVFNLLLIIAVVLGIVAFFQEVWALVLKYILEKDIYDRANYLLGDIPVMLYRKVIIDHWRFGIFRAPSLVRNPNTLGFYLLFVFTIYLNIKKKKNPAVFVSLLTGIIVSVSRKVYMELIFLTIVQAVKNRRKIAVPFIILTVMFFFIMSFIVDFNKWEFTVKGQYAELMSRKQYSKMISFREYFKDKSVEIWRDHPYLGVGPGMFGGVVSIMYDSPVYDEYNVQKIAKALLTRWRDPHQFWPVLLAEMGILGVVSFVGLFASLFFILFLLRKRAVSDEMRGLFTGLTVFTAIILIHSFSSSIKEVIILMYFALLGMGLGCTKKC